MYRQEVQCVSLDSPTFVIYPEIKATEVIIFSLLKLSSAAIVSGQQNDTGGIQRNTLYTDLRPCDSDGMKNAPAIFTKPKNVLANNAPNIIHKL